MNNLRTLTDPHTAKVVMNAAGQKQLLTNRYGNAVPVPDKPARVTKSSGQFHEHFNIHAINREDANHLIVALERVPNLHYIALELMRLVHPILEDEVL